MIIPLILTQAKRLRAQRRRVVYKGSSSDPIYRAYRFDPVGFCHDVLGLDLWSRQEEMLASFGTNARTAIRSGHKTGKSTGLAAAAIWWVSTWDDRECILMSSGAKQIRKILWPEIRKLRRNAKRPLGGSMSIDPDNGLMYPDGRMLFGLSTNEPERAAGFSGAELLFLLDEGSGINEEIYTAIEGNRAGGARLGMAGNPTQPSGTFFDAFHDSADFWHTIHVSSLETPNYVQDSPIIPGLATREWVEEKRREWGEDDARWYVRVLGEFAAQASNCVVGLKLLGDAFARFGNVAGEGRLNVGVDVARFGDDDSSIVARRGLVAVEPVRIHGQDTFEVSQAVIRVVRSLRDPREVPLVKVDGIGVGAGVVDNLRRVPDLEVVDVNTACRADEILDSDDPGYSNLRAQVAFGIAKWLKAGGALPMDRKIQTELVATQYGFDGQNRLKVESKDEIKKRIKRSPDDADALALAIYEPPIRPRSMGGEQLGLM